MTPNSNIKDSIRSLNRIIRKKGLSHYFSVVFNFLDNSQKLQLRELSNNRLFDLTEGNFKKEVREFCRTKFAELYHRKRKMPSTQEIIIRISRQIRKAQQAAGKLSYKKGETPLFFPIEILSSEQKSVKVQYFSQVKDFQIQHRCVIRQIVRV